MSFQASRGATMIRWLLERLRLVERPAISVETDKAIAAILMLEAFRQEHGYHYSNQRFQ
jgi:hypothetical protein